MTPLIFDSAFIYLLAYRLGSIIAVPAIILVALSYVPLGTTGLLFLRRKRHWLCMASIAGLLLMAPHLLDTGPPAVYRLYRP